AGTCTVCGPTVCEAWAEADRFWRFWFKGGWVINGFRALQSRGVFAFLHQYHIPLIVLSCTGLMLWVTWRIPYWFPGWYSALSDFVYGHPLFVVALSFSLLGLLFWLLLWKLPQWQVAYVFDRKDRIDLESKVRQTLAQIGPTGGNVR